jgi:hypothetical protein
MHRSEAERATDAVHLTDLRRDRRLNQLPGEIEYPAPSPPPGLPAAGQLLGACLDVLHVAQRLDGRRRSGALDGAWASVVGREREFDVAEAVEHLPQVASAGEDVGARVVAGKAKLACGRWHQLEQPSGASAGPRLRVHARLLVRGGDEQLHRHAGCHRRIYERGPEGWGDRAGAIERRPSGPPLGGTRSGGFDAGRLGDEREQHQCQQTRADASPRDRLSLRQFSSTRLRASARAREAQIHLGEASP